MDETATRRKKIDPKLYEVGWEQVPESEILTEQRAYITPGQVSALPQNRHPKKADYILEYKKQKLAVIEAKSDEKHVSEGVDQAKLYADLLKILRYDGHTGDSLTVSLLTDVRQMQAYMPYILGVYVSSRLLFMAENAAVPMTREAIARGHIYNMVGTTVSTTFALPTYRYDAEASAFVLGDSDCRVAPFRACIVAAETGTAGGDAATGDGEVYSLLFFSQGAWGAMGNPEGHDSQSAVSLPSAPATAEPSRCAYLLTGQRRLLGTARGLCIVDGKKVIVR